jgi:hypothetical protein
MVAGTRLDVTLHVHCLSCLKLMQCYTAKCDSRLILLGTVQYGVWYALGALSNIVVALTLNFKHSRHNFHIKTVSFVMNFV